MQQSKKKLTLPMWLLFGPIGAIVLGFIMLSVARALTPEPTGDELFAEDSPIVKALNLVAFLINAVGVVGLIIGLPVGMALLVARIMERRRSAGR